MNKYTRIFIKIVEDLIEKQLDILTAPPNRTSQIIKCKRILETIIIRKCLANIKLRNKVECAKCKIQLVIIAPWWELDNYSQMHVCMRCNLPICEYCMDNSCICEYVSFLTFDIYQRLEVQFSKFKKNENNTVYRLQ